MKAAPVIRALARHGSIRQRLVHTGQHYDAAMSDRFFQQLELPAPDINLEVGAGSHATQTAQVIMRLEPELQAHRPDVLVVYGDVNSTMAAALTAAKLHIPVAHVEAGLRSFDRTMPEEINRVVTDRVSSLFLTPSADGDENLQREGVSAGAIRRIGNVMIDSLIRALPAADGHAVLERAGLPRDARIVLVTLHRPSSVDDPGVLQRLIGALREISSHAPVIFPVHPRTRSRISADWIADDRLHLTDPLSYFEFIGLEQHAALVITDSGGVQEETTYLGVPCLTVRENTERPVTISHGSNTLVGRDPGALLAEARSALSGGAPVRRVPELWDGRAGERAAAALLEFVRDQRSGIGDRSFD
jgi:UDP-N-acetylglucosamine 2-epimerase (non-hydrolysing)